MPNEYTIHNGNGNENEEEESIMFGHLQTLRFSKACVSRKVVATGYWLLASIWTVLHNREAATMRANGCSSEGEQKFEWRARKVFG